MYCISNLKRRTLRILRSYPLIPGRPTSPPIQIRLWLVLVHHINYQ
jgi:hypothetical protein